MKTVLDFDFYNVCKAAEKFINECVENKRGRKYAHLYMTINGQRIEIKEPISMRYIEIKNPEGEAIWE